ncbi:hypothetical protein, partial [Ligilactobacillus equi]
NNWVDMGVYQSDSSGKLLTNIFVYPYGDLPKAISENNQLFGVDIGQANFSLYGPFFKDNFDGGYVNITNESILASVANPT